MNITFQASDKVNGTLTAVIEPADYQEKLAKSIKDYSKKLNLPGFRPGKVPAGLVKKQFGQSLLAEEVNKLLQEKLYDYIRDEKINMLGEPLPTEENNKNTFMDGDTFTFTFDIAIAPEFKVSLTKKDKVDYYNVTVSDEMVQNQVQMYRQRGGSYEKVDSYEDNDMIKGVITELDATGNVVEGGVTAEGVVMLPKYFRGDEQQKKLFEGAKVNDVIRFNPAKAYDNSEAELASLLKVEKEKATEYKNDFNFQITEITRYMPGPLNQDLFDQVFPKGTVTTAEDFAAKIKEQIEQQFKKDADYRFLLDLRKHVTEKVGKLEFPDEKLKRIMLANAKGDQKKVDDNYDKSVEELTWHLVKEQLVEMTGVKVEDGDVLEMAREVTRMQFAQYGMLNIPDEYIENSVTEMLKKRETVDNLIDRCIEVKLGTALKEKISLNEKSVTAEEFNKLFEN
ncbi:MAG: trigger factor [Bacteroidaceae bacterium]|nr:trigger factor [Bacteroidaceae bacterium]